jgi:hypothetical protein
MNSFIQVKNINAQVFSELKNILGDIHVSGKIIYVEEITSWLFDQAIVSDEWLMKNCGDTYFSLEMIGYVSEREDDSMVSEADLLIVSNRYPIVPLINVLTMKLKSFKKDISVDFYTE